MEAEQARLLTILVEAARRVAPADREPFAALKIQGRADVRHPGLNPRPNVYFGDLLALDHEGYLVSRTVTNDQIVFDVSPQGFEKYGELKGAMPASEKTLPPIDLSAQQMTILGLIWKTFTETCEWPIYQWLDLTLEREHAVNLGACVSNDRGDAQVGNTDAITRPLAAGPAPGAPFSGPKWGATEPILISHTGS